MQWGNLAAGDSGRVVCLAEVCSVEGGERERERVTCSQEVVGSEPRGSVHGAGVSCARAGDDGEGPGAECGGSGQPEPLL